MANCSDVRCERIPLVYSGPVILTIRQEIFLIQFALGIAGNFLNLMILNSPSMRSKTNVLLSCMAACDILFLLSRFPAYLASIQSLAFNNSFRRIYYHVLKLPVTVAMASWFSAASIWYISILISRV